MSRRAAELDVDTSAATAQDHHVQGITIGATVTTDRVDQRGLPGPGAPLGPAVSLAAAGVAGGVTLGGAAFPPEAEVPGGVRYRVIDEIARGGVGVVMRAIDRDVRREVAIKVMGGDPNSARSRLRFVEEAQVTGQLDHPNIVPVHDLGLAEDGRPWFSMKLLKGRTMAEALSALRRGTPGEWNLPRLVTALIAVCHGVAYAHSRGVVHRDLKPANIMLGHFGEVWVCDWGLAKVGAARRWLRQRRPLAPAAPSAARPPVRDAALRTQQGVVEGTPAYMAPEQAMGDMRSIDERTDIYALGAILYEILCLEPPCGGPGESDVLAQVAAGRIIPPALRNETRAIPIELSAVAMKALAHDPIRRYAQVAELRADLERWLEGRAVSAKTDSAVETIVKFVRRNRAVSAATTIAVIVLASVLVVGFRVNLDARRLAEAGHEQAREKNQQLIAANSTLEQTLTKLSQERLEREAEQRRAAPALVESGRRLAERRSFVAARRDAELAVDYDPALPAALLLRAHLLLHDQEFSAAAKDLSQWLRLPRDPEPRDEALVRQLLDLAVKAADEASSATITAVADLLSRHAGLVYAEDLFKSAGSLSIAYRAALERAWPGSTRSGFGITTDGQLIIEGLSGRHEVKDLAPLAGMPIARINLSRTKVVDLSPLRDAPLVDLDLSDTPIKSLGPLNTTTLKRLVLARSALIDLTPLAGKPLEEIDLAGTQVVDLSPLTLAPLRSVRLAGSRVTDLAPLAAQATSAALVDLDCSNTNVADLSPLKGHRLSTLRVSYSKVGDLTPVAGHPLVVLAVDHTAVTSLAPIAGAPIRSLAIAGSQVANLEPVSGFPLGFLDLSDLPVSDLRPLARMPLFSLVLSRTQISSLDPLRGLRLTSLAIADTRISDLTPLKDMPLTSLDLVRTHVSDLRPLLGRPLTSLLLDQSQVTDLRPLAALPLRELRLSGLPIADATPLKDVPLERLIIDVAKIKTGVDVLRGKPGLRHLGNVWEGSWSRVPNATDFWLRFKP